MRGSSARIAVPIGTVRLSAGRPRVRMVAGTRVLLGALVAMLATAPGTVGAQGIPSERTVLAALTGKLDRLPARPATLFAPSEPRRLRPCCAFGGDMKVKLVGLPLPWYRHQPLRAARDIGPHEYDPGVLQILPSPIDEEGPGPGREHNGIVYTCRGGFLDTAHIRDFADLTWFLAAPIESRLETGGTIDLIDYGGVRRVAIQPVPRAKLARAGRARLAIAVAARLSFDLSVWREIATWYGYESVPPWPEKLSSFSPEDLYSNLLGTKLAADILRSKEIHTHREWDLAVTAWLTSALDALGVVPVETARGLMDSVDGVFWNSERWIPDWRITVRRKFDRGPSVTPWVVHSNARARTLQAACGRNDTPVALRADDTLAGISVDGIAAIEVVPSERLLEHGLPLPRPGDRRIVEADFKRLIEAVRRETEAGVTERTKQPQTARR